MQTFTTNTITHHQLHCFGELMMTLCWNLINNSVENLEPGLCLVQNCFSWIFFQQIGLVVFQLQYLRRGLLCFVGKRRTEKKVGSDKISKQNLYIEL